MIDDPLIIAGIGLCIAVLGIIMALNIRDKRKKPETKWEEVGEDKVPF